MPITFRVDHECREIYAVAEGPITPADIRQHLEEERYAGALAYRELIDGSKAIVAVAKGMGNVASFLLGSITTRLVERSHVSVLVVR